MSTSTRRACLTGVASTTLLLALPYSHCLSTGTVSAETTGAMNEWMNNWMSASKEPRGALHLSRFREPIYFLTKSISWIPNAGQKGYKTVVVPKGFVTDFASIPRPFWSLLRPDGAYTYPAIIHDFLYWTQGVPRDVADMIFKMAMQDFEIGVITSEIIYDAVRAGGSLAWDDNATQKANGERRILRRFPEDPRITWADWKRDPEVFVD